MVKRIMVFILCAALSCLFISCGDEKTIKKNTLDDAITYETVYDDIRADSNKIIEETKTENNDPDAPEADVDLPLSGIKICIDAGHGLFEKNEKEPIGPGSSTTKAAFVTGTSGNYQSEAEFNLKVALLLQNLLEEQGATVYMTRTDEYAYLSNIGRAQLGNDNNCDISVRIHADGSENSEIHGISMLIPARNEFITDDYILNESSKAGKAVLDEVLRKTGASGRGIIPRDDMTGFNWSTIPSILIECGFMTNFEEDRKLAEPEYQQLIAEGICQGLITYFNS